MSEVAVFEGQDASKITWSALSMAGAKEALGGKNVFIKLNFGGPSGKRGAVVSEEVTRAVIRYLKPVCGKITVGEQGRATREESEALFNRMWARDMEKELDVRFLNLWDDEYVEVEVPRPFARRTWKIPRSVATADAVVSLACLKVSAAAGVTLAMKNFFGIIPRKNKAFLHGRIHRVVADLNQIVKPVLGIIDGIYGWEGGESAMGGEPVEMNLVMASRDIVALDTVAAEIMGRDSRRVAHIRMADQAGLGTSDLDEIDVVGKEISDVRRSFAPPPLYQRLGGRVSALSGIANSYFMWRGEDRDNV